MELEVIDLGLIEYQEAYELQKRKHAEVLNNGARECLFLLEHFPVITLGRNANESNLLLSREKIEELGVKVTESDRGGDVTYHGPGQLVAYPILNLRHHRMDISWYVGLLEDAAIALLRSFGVVSSKVPGRRGVWVGNEKIASVGLRVKRWVTMHGIAINLCPNLSHFDLIIPCGLVGVKMTSVEKITGMAPDMKRAKELFADILRKCLRLSPLSAGPR